MDELALILDAQRGEVNAFNTLVLAYQGRAYNVAYRLMGDAHAADDATQEAFIAAFRNLGQYRGGSFGAWLLRIVTNACLDELRRLKRRPTVSTDDLGEDADESALVLTADPDEGPESVVMQQALNRAIQDCLDDLPDPFRVVAVLGDLEGYDYQEIARIAGISLGTVKSRLSRARGRLRDCLQGAGELLPARYRLSEQEDRAQTTG